MSSRASNRKCRATWVPLSYRIRAHYSYFESQRRQQDQVAERRKWSYLTFRQKKLARVWVERTEAVVRPRQRFILRLQRSETMRRRTKVYLVLKQITENWFSSNESLPRQNDLSCLARCFEDTPGTSMSIIKHVLLFFFQSSACSLAEQITVFSWSWFRRASYEQQQPNMTKFWFHFLKQTAPASYLVKESLEKSYRQAMNTGQPSFS